MTRVIVPNFWYDTKESPIIFLAGPIKCAPAWHETAINYIKNSVDIDLVIACPKSKLIGIEYRNSEGTQASRNREWERFYLEKASINGVIMFWLPGPERSNTNYPYGGMTRKELGDWTTHKNLESSVNLCIGTDGNFPLIDTLEYDFSRDLPNLVIHKNLEKTCREALNCIK